VTTVDGRLPYQRIADQIRQKINDGTYQVGARVPTVKALTLEYGAATNTITRALDELRKERRIESAPGRGTVVLPPPPRPADVEHLRVAVEDLAARVGDQHVTREEFEALQLEVGKLHGLVMDIYARSGWPNPEQSRHTGPTRARRASGQ
jgi:GntR family transcriptional regulator